MTAILNSPRKRADYPTMRNHLESALANLRSAALECTDSVLKQSVMLLIRDVQRMLAKHQARSQSVAYQQFHHQLKFLLALEDTVLAKVLEAIVRTRGHDVSSVRGGADAIRRLEQDQFDIVLLDMTLPDAKDILALERLRVRDQELQRHTPVIAMTNLNSKDVAMDEWVGLLDAYVNSPFQPDRFFDVIQKVLARSSTWS